MVKTYKKQDILELLKGGDFLSGGVGAYTRGCEMLEKLEAQGYNLAFDLLTLDDMEADQCAATVGVTGDYLLTDGDELILGLKGAYGQLQEACRNQGKSLKYLFCNGLGGFGLLTPILLAIFSGKAQEKIGLIDVSGNCRGFSSFKESLMAARGIVPTPLTAAGYIGGGVQEQTVIYPASSEEADKYLDGLLKEGFKWVTYSATALSKDDLEENTGENYISYAKRVGEAMGNKEVPLYDALHSVIPQVKEFYTGTIYQLVSGKIYFNNDVIQDLRIGILHEVDNLILCRLTDDGRFGEVYVTAPEVISIVDEKTGNPLSNGDRDLYIGQKIRIFISPAHYYWWDRKEAYKHYLTKLSKNQYHCDPVRYSPMFEDNRADKTMNIKLPFVSADKTLQDKLRDYLQTNLYDDEEVYWERVQSKGYHSQEDLQASEPTVTEEDIVRNGPDLLSLSKEGYADIHDKFNPWSGHYIGRFGDEKTTRALREVVSRPVFDAFDASIYLTLTVADKIGIITWPETMVPILERRIAAVGLDQRYLWVKAAASADVRDIKLAADKLVEAGAQAILIGQSFWDKNETEYNKAELLQKQMPTEIPVIDANKTGIRWMEMAIHMGYFHSRLSYFTPPVKKL